jgi:hypothetical protein
MSEQQPLTLIWDTDGRTGHAETAGVDRDGEGFGGGQRRENTVVVLVNCRGMATYRSRYCIAYIQWPRRVVRLCNALQMVVSMLVAAAQPRKEMAMAA